ncbi:sensor histidine kinase [Clostridium chauvoei]|uniref:histidine kinase n=2 Tax=Clostridium chauvoei TaxID=46867 RepID=S6EU99_9CLOT|nr:HAMP domain-containing sensor histidine kinase [Clostridium chauvoei]ATD53868.1 two-component sensor histidine kinase [Clostridium chauvoei]ATD58327.1 two-component sensor histidine kinase [Clostridium chauvoei]MBX7280371.1 cell wall metabolism sensor histidine kinase WalK [Clostridium chauvoei]MBX7282856.1 cell wall metabolism sensor histidine kinase WalK [Clostridium chauvoei]MBX7285262.1 cell wall metabolism sensor histidine kinase WalK [Clostridium chauvoei]
MNRKGIAYKLTITFTSIIAVILVLIGMILSIWFNKEYKLEKQRVLEKQLVLVEEATISFLSQNTEYAYDKLRDTMNMIESSIDMDSVIIDNLGYIYVVSDNKYNKEKYTKLNIEEEALIKLKNGETVNSKFIDSEGIERKTYIRPIFNKGYFNGAIVLIGNNIYVKMPNRIYIIIWISVVLALIVSSIITYYFSEKIIIKPLEEINNAAKKIAKGEVEKRVNIKSNDEIGELGDSFNIMAESLEQVDKKRRDFISNVSHELRSPITSIKGFITGILDGVIPKDKENYYLTIVNDEISRLTRLVTDLLDISAMESGKFNLNMVELDINEVITLCTLNLEGKIKEKNINVEVVFHNKHEYAIADRDRLIQVITNLIENAIKYGEDNGEIKINTYLRTDKVYVSIFNSGSSIPKEDINNIWDRFYKSDKARTNKISTGLGLPIVRLILSQHGQDIWVNNIDGKGVRFTFSLKKAN